MKRILITGKDSYVGCNLERRLAAAWPDSRVHSLDMRDDSWRQHDFTGYDAVVHVAGIAHVSADPRHEELYFRVNRDLAVETATVARSAGVGQFIFMSSIIVYGGSRSRNGLIDRKTEPVPRDFYGRSKLEAERGLSALARDDFQVAIIRSPMVFGPGAKGNYPRLAKLARRTPLFPLVSNRRSMIHIDNLCELIRLLVADGAGGVFFPQEREYVQTGELVRLIAAARGRKLFLVKGCDRLLKAAAARHALLDKLFGDLAYELELSTYAKDYRLRDLPSSILATEAPSEEGTRSDA